MSFVFDSGKQPYRYVYLGASHRDSEGRPRNSRARVGRVDANTGARVYADGFVGLDVFRDIMIQPDLKRRIEEEDRLARERHPHLFCEADAETRRLVTLCRRRKAPLFAFRDLESVTCLEGGVLPLLERAAGGSGLLESLRLRLPGSWGGLFALGAFLAARDEGLEAADLWLRGSAGPEADLTPDGIGRLLESLRPDAGELIASDLERAGGPEPALLHLLGEASAPLPVGAVSWLPRAPADGARRGDPAAMVIPAPPDGWPLAQNMENFLGCLPDGGFLAGAPPDLPEIAGRAAVSPRGGAFRLEAGGRLRDAPLWLLLEPDGRGGLEAAVSNCLADPGSALGHLSLRRYLEEVSLKAKRRLDEIRGGGGKRLRRQAGLAVFVTQHLASLAWKACRSSEALRGLPPSRILRELGGVTRVAIRRFLYTKTLSEFQKEIFTAFGVAEWEIQGISGQARPVA